jgi:hypothetical protein
VQKDSVNLPDTALHRVPRAKVLYNDNGRFKEYIVRKGALEHIITGQTFDDEVLLKGESGEIYAVKREYGKGNLIVCSAPKLFTNIHLLYQSPELVQKFYQLDNSLEVYWANNYFSRDALFTKSNKSLLDFVYKYQSLTWAWYLFLCGGVLYILFNMRRLQSYLPKMDSNNNLSLEFVRSVAMLYRKKSGNTEIFKKKVDLFYGSLYERFGILKQQTPQEKAELLAIKVGNRDAQLSFVEMFEGIEYNLSQNKISDKKYFELFNKIESFNNKYIR